MEEKLAKIRNAIGILVVIAVVGVIIFGVHKFRNKESVSLDYGEIEIKVGEEKQITATVNPKDADYKWFSSNTDVATVSDGKILGVSEGVAIITAKINDDVFEECKVKVKLEQPENIENSKRLEANNDLLTDEIMVYPEQIDLDKTEVEMYVNDVVTVRTTIKPDNVTDDSVRWSSSDESVVTVYNGEIKSLKVGTATVVAQTINDIRATISVTVKEAPVKSLKIDQNNESITVGGSVTLSVTSEPIVIDNDEIIWKSSDTNIATVSKGVVTGKKEGSVTISAESKDGVKASTKINVTKINVPITSIKVTAKSNKMYVDETLKLIATIEPADATNKNVKWSSSNKDIATVSSSGRVTAKSVGKVEITAAAGGKSAKYQINVLPIPVKSISLNKSNASLKVGSMTTIVATISPSNATNKRVTWSSSNTSVATVINDGKVNAKGVGTAIITATTEDGKKTARVLVEVTPVTVDTIYLSEKNIELAVGGSKTLNFEVLPTNATNRNITWSTSNSSVATVANGKITAVGVGTATITVRSVDGGATNTCNVTVKSTVTNVSVTGVTISPTSYSMQVGSSTRFTATISPSNATNKNVTWSSTNNNVATVSDTGLVVGKAVGTATIKVTTKDGGKVASAVVNITEIPVSSVVVQGPTTMQIGQSSRFVTVIQPSSATNKSVTWKSSNTSVATIDQSGNVIARNQGTTTIMATANNGRVGSLVLTVKPISVTSISTGVSSSNIQRGDSFILSYNVAPSNATNLNLSITVTSGLQVMSGSSSSSPNGSYNIKAVGLGTQTITLRSSDGYTKKVTVTVQPSLPRAITLNKSNVVLDVGSQTSFTVTFTPSDVDERSITWTSSNSSIASVTSGGVVTARKSGTATIRATTVNGVTASAVVNVRSIPVSQIVINGPYQDGETVKISSPRTIGFDADILPSNATDKTVQWIVSGGSCHLGSSSQSGTSSHAIIVLEPMDGVCYIVAETTTLSRQIKLYVRSN